MFGFLQSGGDHLGYIAATDDLIPIQFLAGNMPTYVRSIFMLTGILFPKVRGALKALGSLTEATNGMLKSRLAALQSGLDDSKPPRADILGKLMDISHKNGKELDFRLDDVKVEVFVALYVPQHNSVAYEGISILTLETASPEAKPPPSPCPESYTTFSATEMCTRNSLRKLTPQQQRTNLAPRISPTTKPSSSPT
jgi:hypothetical protein